MQQRSMQQQQEEGLTSEARTPRTPHARRVRYYLVASFFKKYMMTSDVRRFVVTECVNVSLDT